MCYPGQGTAVCCCFQLRGVHFVCSRCPTHRGPADPISQCCGAELLRESVSVSDAGGR